MKKIETKPSETLDYSSSNSDINAEKCKYKTNMNIKQVDKIAKNNNTTESSVNNSVGVPYKNENANYIIQQAFNNDDKLNDNASEKSNGCCKKRFEFIPKVDYIAGYNRGAEIYYTFQDKVLDYEYFGDWSHIHKNNYNQKNYIPVYNNSNWCNHYHDMNVLYPADWSHEYFIHNIWYQNTE